MKRFYSQTTGLPPRSFPVKRCNDSKKDPPADDAGFKYSIQLTPK